MYPYNQNAYGRPPMAMPPGMQSLPPGFGFPPGMAPAGGSAPLLAPGMPSTHGMLPPGTSQASLPSRPGVSVFSPPVNLPNINFNAPIIRLGTSGSRNQAPAIGSNTLSSTNTSNNSTLSARANYTQHVGSSVTRESASSFIAPTIEEQLKSVYLGSLPLQLEDDWIERILRATGPLRRWVRAADENGKPCKFGFAEFDTFDGVQAALKSIKGLKIPSPSETGKITTILITYDDRAEEYMSLNTRDRSSTHEEEKEEEEEEHNHESRYESIRSAIDNILEEYANPDRHVDVPNSDKIAINASDIALSSGEGEKDQVTQPEVVTISLTIDDELADIPTEMRETVSKEIAAFRERSNRRDMERVKREEDIEQQEKERIQGGRNHRFASPPASAPTGPSAGSNSIPVGPSRQRGDAPPSAPTGPSSQVGRDYQNTVKFVNGSHNPSARFPHEEDEPDVSDSELDLRRKQKQMREGDTSYLDHERRWLNRERSRASAIERETQRDRDDIRREDIEKGAMALRLAEWDDDVEAEKRLEDYYVDRSLWIRNRSQFRSREKELDLRDKAQEERLLESERKTVENGSSNGKDDILVISSSKDTPVQPRIKLSLGASARNKANDNPRPRRIVADIEGLLEDEEEDLSKTRRVLIPIQYEDTSAIDDESREELVKALAHEIPSDKDGLWNWSVKWDFVDESMIKEKLQPFIEKKIVEYLGVQEQELINFVLEHIKKRGTAGDLVRELEMALDEDAEVLVKKVWRMLIFFSEGEKRGLVN